MIKDIQNAIQFGIGKDMTNELWAKLYLQRESNKNFDWGDIGDFEILESSKEEI